MSNYHRDEWESEAEMAARLVAWLEHSGYDVYQEVEYLAGIADVVAVKNKQILVVECKLQFSFHVVEQASNWKTYADFVAVGLPSYYWGDSSYRSRRNASYPPGWSYGFRSCFRDNIGVMLIGKEQAMADAVYMPHGLPPRTHVVDAAPMVALPSSARERFLGILRPEHKTYAKAGSPTGRRWSPFKETCENLRKYVVEHPGCSIKDAAMVVKHHYKKSSTFVRCMPVLIQKGAVPGVKATSDHHLSAFKLYPAPEEVPAAAG